MQDTFLFVHLVTWSWIRARSGIIMTHLWYLLGSSLSWTPGANPNKSLLPYPVGNTTNHAWWDSELESQMCCKACSCFVFNVYDTPCSLKTDCTAAVKAAILPSELFATHATPYWYMTQCICIDFVDCVSLRMFPTEFWQMIFAHWIIALHICGPWVN